MAPDDPLLRRETTTTTLTESGDRSHGVRLAVADLWRQQVPVVQQRLASIEAYVDEVTAGAPTTAGHREALDATHKFAGALGTYGFRDAGRTARRLEEILVDPFGPPDASELAAVFHRLQEELSS